MRSCAARWPHAGRWPQRSPASPSAEDRDGDRAAELRAEPQQLCDLLIVIVSQSLRHRVQMLIDELEAEARALSDGNANED